MYKECSHCGTIMEDEDDIKVCLICGQNPFRSERYSQEELVDKIKKGEISLGSLKIKNWAPFYPIIQDLSSPSF